MDKWEQQITRTTIGEIQLYCVEDESWQSFRKSLKGISTEKKLDKLFWWRNWNRRSQVQVDNYLNALLRGGQLVRRQGEIMTREHWLKVRPEQTEETLNSILNGRSTNACSNSSSRR
jgi:hypothetical protein